MQELTHAELNSFMYDMWNEEMHATIRGDYIAAKVFYLAEQIAITLDYDRRIRPWSVDELDGFNWRMYVNAYCSMQTDKIAHAVYVNAYYMSDALLDKMLEGN